MMGTFSSIFAFVVSIGQGILLVQYAVHYTGNPLYWFMLAAYVPALVGLIFYSCQGWRRALSFVWLLHVVALVPTTGVVLFQVDHKLATSSFLFGPSVLKMSLCLSPIILFFLLSASSDSGKHRKHACMISCSTALDLFDGIDILGFIVDDDVQSVPGIPPIVKLAIAFIACFAFLLSALEIREHRFHEDDRCKCGNDSPGAWSRIIGHLPVNVGFLILRLVLWIHFQQEASMFIAKSGLSILGALWELFQMISSC